VEGRSNRKRLFALSLLLAALMSCILLVPLCFCFCFHHCGTFSPFLPTRTGNRKYLHYQSKLTGLGTATYSLQLIR
jgi:hypothetical protein